MASPGPRRGWWRRNRLALAILPLVVALIGLLGSYRFVNFYAQYELTKPARAAAGESVTLVQEWSDASGAHLREVTLGAGPTRVVATYPGADGQEVAIAPVEGTQVWRIPLQVQADPEQVLTGCSYAVVDQHGRVATGTVTGMGDHLLSVNYCVPAATPGPDYDMGELWEFTFDDEPAAARPESYTVPLFVRLAQDAVPVEVRVWWERPEYAALALQAQDALGERIEP